MKEKTCSQCSFFNNGSQFLEDSYAGLNALSSAWGCVRGDAGLCSLHDVYLFPRGTCEAFQDRTANHRSMKRQAA